MTKPLSDKGMGDFNLSDFIPLREAVEISGLSASHLRLLVSSGKLWGQKLGRDWFTTRSAVEAYLAEGHKPGPKPKKTS